MGTSNPARKTVHEVVDEWPDHSRSTAIQLLDRYGPPDEATTQRLIWHDNGPWSRTVLHRDGPKHQFPMPHRDYLEQFIDYRVPTDKFDDLARYDGSIHAHRTRGEMGAVCHTEQANTLALNLAHEVITGERTPEAARETYAMIMAKGKTGGSPAYMEELQFDVPAGDQRDSDVTIVTDEIKRTARNLVGRSRGD